MEGPTTGKLYLVRHVLHSALKVSGSSGDTTIGINTHETIPKGTIVLALNSQTIIQSGLNTRKLGSRLYDRFVYDIEYLVNTDVFRSRIEGYTPDCWAAFFDRVEEA